jgi:uncharacterized protein (DUF2252 family)
MAKGLKQKVPHENTHNTQDVYRSREEAAAYGRSLRDKTPRVSHAGWKAPAERRDPVDILIESSEGREPNLIPIRYGRMLQSPLMFFYGAAAIMAADLFSTPSIGLYVQACGDCHLMNFGGYATPERRMLFDINDFDETLPAPWEWDVKRLAASFVIASFNNGIAKDEAVNAAKECVASYRKHITEYAGMDMMEMWYTSILFDDIVSLIEDSDIKKRIKKRIDKAAGGNLVDEDFPKLAEIRNGKAYIKDSPPLIYHFPEKEAKEIYPIVAHLGNRYLEGLSEEKRLLLSYYKLQDYAAKVVGVGSVGMLCGISLRMSADNDPLFLQMKEARNSVLEPYTAKSKYDNQGERVVNGQKIMQAAPDMFLGWAETSDNRYFYIRQLRDMKVKLQVEIFDAALMHGYATLCGWVLARAHARSGKAAVIDGYLGNSNKFEKAVAAFAIDYANQNNEDFNALKQAVKQGRVEAFFER